MDKCTLEPLQTVAQLKKIQKNGKPRLPLAPSEKHNSGLVSRKHLTREVASRYKSGITTRANPNTNPRRYPSPDASHHFPTTGASLPERAQSAERRPSTSSSRSSSPNRSSKPSMCLSSSSKSTTPVNDFAMEMHNTSSRSLATRTLDGLWPSIRSLSSSFQAESFAGKKDRMVTNASSDQALKSSTNMVTARKKTPLGGRNSLDLFENSKPVENSTTRPVDKKMLPGVMDGKVTSTNLARSGGIFDKVSQSASSLISSRGVSPRRMPISRAIQQPRNEMARKVSLNASGRGKHDSISSLSAPSHPVRTQSSPIPRLHRLPSPSRTLSAPSLISKTMQSPLRASSTPFSLSRCKTSQVSATPSVLSYIVDVHKGKKSENHVDNVHQLQLLYNRDLQWRFVNALALDALFIQKIRTENTLYNVWDTTAVLWESVTLKRICIQQLKQEMKLNLILREQTSYLDEWAVLDMDYNNSLSGAIGALKASTLRLPVSGGARV
ncbi:QWRF motif-containing protein 4-like isoform X2 [Asparagus officinalis]|uniref:QWRF motif-containing protein 4-like isoform X2 n=1 Tax=Asparagus officinalis TaxID=4686 RepID=UPI00098DFCD5|nr:QWRF motif-containing protein 4-like isoform X2 [Asparagus officinalis]